MENLFDAAERAEEKIYLIVDDYDSFTNRFLLLDVDNLFRSEAMLRSFGNALKTAVIDRMIIVLFNGLTPMTGYSL